MTHGPPKGYRWLRANEAVPDNARWFDEDAEDTDAPLLAIHGQPSIYQARRSDLLEWHAGRHWDWPSDAHGLCGIVVPA